MVLYWANLNSLSYKLLDFLFNLCLAKRGLEKGHIFQHFKCTESLFLIHRIMIFEILLFHLLRCPLVILVFSFIKSVELIKIIIQEVYSIDLLYQWCLSDLLGINDSAHWRDLALHIWFIGSLLVIHEVVLSSEILA